MLYNLSVIEMMGDNDPEFIQTLLKIFVDSIPPDLDLLNNAVEAKDWDQVAFIAHKMKSTIDNLSVDSLKDVIRILEAKDLKTSLPASTILLHISKVNTVLHEVIASMKEDYPGL